MPHSILDALAIAFGGAAFAFFIWFVLSAGWIFLA